VNCKCGHPKDVHGVYDGNGDACCGNCGTCKKYEPRDKKPDIVRVQVGLVLQTNDGVQNHIGEAVFEIDNPNWGVLYTTIVQIEKDV
jgi:hypothetical protein